MVLAVFGNGCSTEPGADLRGAPYLAIVTKVEEGTALDATATYTYRVKNLSVGTAPLDTVITVTPADTVILALPPSTYRVVLDSLPERCEARHGTAEEIVLDPETNTGVARFLLFCKPALTVTITTLGPGSSTQYVWALKGSDGVVQRGLTDPIDKIVVDGVAPGDYFFHLGFVDSDCIGATTGGLTQPVTVGASGGATLNFRLVCSQETTRPRIDAFHWSYHDGAAVFVARLADPDFNIANYSFDLTDCAGTSRLSGGPRFREGLDAGRTVRRDTMTILAAFELGIPDSEMHDACAALRVEDRSGNSTLWVERPLETSPGSPPVAEAFNVVLNGTAALHTTLSASDPDGDFIGTVATLRLRDGTFGQPDGAEEVIPYNVQGYLGTEIPIVPLGDRILYTDVYASIIYLVDAEGHFTRLEDSDTFK